MLIAMAIHNNFKTGSLASPMRTSLLWLAISLAAVHPAAAQLTMYPAGSAASNIQASQNQDQTDSTSNSRSTTDYQYQPYQPVELNGPSQGETRSSSAENGNDSSTSRQILNSRGQEIKRPTKPSEFEQYVQTAVGHKIPRFGSELLIKAERDFAVPAQATIPPDYALNIGDTVSVSLTGSIEGSANFTINTSGSIYLPKIGEVTLLGVRYRDLKDRIADAIGRKYRGYEVSVGIKQLRGVRVYVTGFANNPGAYTVNSLSTLVNGVLAAGGPNAGGSFRSVQLIRNGRVVADFDLYELLRRGDRSRDPILLNEDVLFIPPVGEQVAVIGSVNEEAIYEAKAGESVADLLVFAGGPNVLGDPSRAILYRLSDKQILSSRELSADQERVTDIMAGDIVQILSQGSLVQPLERQQVVVRLEGEVNRPGNYYVPPNTALSQVLEMAGGLTSRAYVYGTKLTRTSVQQQQRVSFKEAIDQMEFSLTSAPLTGNQLGVTDRTNQLEAARAVLAQLRSQEPDGRLVLPLSYSASTLPGNLLLENNDHITVPPVLRTLGVFGAVYRPASFLLESSEKTKVRDFIEKAGGAQRSADKGNIFVVRANGEVLTRKHGAMGARVRPGDVIFVPVKTQSSSLLAKITAISQMIFQVGLGAAGLAAIQ